MDYRLTTLSVMLIILCILIILVVRYKNNKYEEVKKYIDFIEKTLNEKLNELRSELSYVKLNRDIHFVTRIEYDAVKKCLSYYVDENIKLREHNSKLQEELEMSKKVHDPFCTRLVQDITNKKLGIEVGGELSKKTDIRQQFVNDLILNNRHKQSNEKNACDSPKKDLIENYKFKIKGFKYNGGYSEEIENSLKELGLYGIKYDSENNKITCKYPGLFEQIDVTIESQSFVIVELGNIQVFTNDKALERYKIDN